MSDTYQTQLSDRICAAIYLIAKGGDDPLLTLLKEKAVAVMDGVRSNSSTREKIRLSNNLKDVLLVARTGKLIKESNCDQVVTAIALLNSSMKELPAPEVITESFFVTEKIKRTVVKPRKNRKKQIIDIIKDKGNVTIKDICDVIKDCSEKTVQRALAALVEEGVVTKEGARRWTKYSINNTTI